MSLREGGFVHLPLYFFHSVLATYLKVCYSFYPRFWGLSSKREKMKEKKRKETERKKVI
jgi:hypothetical protein